MNLKEKNPFKTNQSSIENQSKRETTSIEHRSNIDPRATKITSGAKHVARFVLGAVLELSWRRLGRILGANIAANWRPESKESRSKN